MAKRRTKPKSDRVVHDEHTGLEVRYNMHPRRKNALKVAAMYEAYKTGLSLEAVGETYGVTRQAVHDVFRTRGYPLRTKESAGRYFTTCYGVRWYRTKDGYLRGTIGGRRTFLHREVWERKNGPVPRTHVLRFLDGDKTRCTHQNLELVEKIRMPDRFARKKP
jgi:hypothetical protein